MIVVYITFQSVLYELSELAALQAEHLKLFSAEANFEEIKTSRQKLRELAALMVRYTLSMSSNDCGGTSDYSEFFTTMRQVYLFNLVLSRSISDKGSSLLIVFIYGIPELRAELSAELKDVLAVIESNYLEEERRERDIIEAARKKAEEEANAEKEEKERQDRQVQTLLSLIGSFTLPFVVIAGIFGMVLTRHSVFLSFAEFEGLANWSVILEADELYVCSISVHFPSSIFVEEDGHKAERKAYLQFVVNTMKLRDQQLIQIKQLYSNATISPTFGNEDKLDNQFIKPFLVAQHN